MSSGTGPRIVAHRGSSLRHPENTTAAFVGAEREGADGLEFDVRRSADGVLVIHHDADLADGRLLSRTNADQLPPDIPSLAEVLRRHRSMWLNVEIKNDVSEPDYDSSGDLARQVVEEVRSVGDSDGQADDVATREPVGGVVISSFDPPTLSHALTSRAETGAPDASQATGFGFLVWLDESQDGLANRDEVLNDALERAIALGCTALHPHDSLVDRPLVERAHALGLDVNVWTVDDPARIVQLSELDVDGIITNDPTAALLALHRR